MSAAVVMRRIAIAACFGIVGAMAFGTSAAATASPRDPYDTDVPFATGSASVQSQKITGTRYRTAQGNTAVSSRGFTRHRVRSKALYRSGEHSVAQIAPTILRSQDPSMEDEPPQSCATNARRRTGCYQAKSMRPKGLVDALLETPSPSTEPVLRDIGIPVIKDVPPIAILRPAHTDAHENVTADFR